MPCTSTAFAYNAPCDPSPGGIKAILVADPEAVLITGMNFDAGTVTLGPKTSGAKPFYRWEVAPGQSTLQTEAQISEANNVRFFATDIVAALNGFSPTSAGAHLLTKLHRFAIIVELNSGRSVFLGLVKGYTSDVLPTGTPSTPRGADVTAFTWTPGQAKGDAIRANITAHMDSYLLPLSVSNYANLVND